MKFTYPKTEKLKSHSIIGLLFTEGKSVSKFPLRLLYVENKKTNEPVKITVSVSKKHFKKAVDRNHYKRLLRESYRLNKHILYEAIDKPYAFMLLYQTKEHLSFSEIQEKTTELFKKFKNQHS